MAYDSYTFPSVFTDREVLELNKMSKAVEEKSYLTVDSLVLNSGEITPLMNVGIDGSNESVDDKTKNIILGAHVSGAEYGRVYQLQSIRNGLSGTYGITLGSYEQNSDGSMRASTFRKETGYSDPSTFTEDADNGTTTVRVKSEVTPDLTVSIVYQTSGIGTIINLNENENGNAQGTIINPVNYSYRNGIESGEDGTDSLITVDKTAEEARVLIPHRLGYMGYLLRRITKPHSQTDRGSNIDLWSLARISRYNEVDGEIVEDPERVFVYGNALTQDTIFQLAGEVDYSGGAYHGDEILNSFRLVVGNADITADGYVGTYTGATVELIQETILHEDTYNKENGDSPAYLKVNKAHMYSVEKGYTLKTKIETLKDITTTLSNIGSLSMPRAMEHGNTNNWTDVYELSNMKHLDVRSPDSSGNHFSGTQAQQYKMIGYYKQCIVTYESDSDYFDTWVRNWGENDIKLYSRIFPEGELIPSGTVVRASVNYKFD